MAGLGQMAKTAAWLVQYSRVTLLAQQHVRLRKLPIRQAAYENRLLSA